MSEDEAPKEGAAVEDCAVDTPDEGTPDLFDPFEDEHDVDMAPRQIMAEDGMPCEVFTDTSDDIPPLSREGMICMGIFTSFVLRDRWGEVVAEFKPEQVDRNPNGKYSVTVMRAIENIPETVRYPERFDIRPPTWTLRQLARLAWAGLGNDRRIERKTVGALFDESILGDYSDGCVEVEPIRPPCKYYLRQAMPYDKNPKAKKFFRLCSLRRNVEGAMMDIGDTAVWACEGRDPRHASSEGMLERFDDLKIKQGLKRKKLPIVGQPEKDERDVPGLGILGGGKNG